MARVRTLGLWFAAVAVGVVVVAAAAVYVLLNTAPGHEFVLRTALARIQDRIDGTVRVAGIRSDGLLRGASLIGLEITDAGGRPFVALDSLRVGYALPDFLRREFVLTPVEVWSPAVKIERAPGEETTNVERIFRIGGPAPDREEPSRIRIALRDVSLHGGGVEVRLPAEGEEGGLFRTAVDPETGVPLHAFSFREIEGRFEEVSLLEPGREGELARVGDLSFTGHVLAEPFRVASVRGVLHRDRTGVTLAAERLWLPGTEASGTVHVDLRDELLVDADLRANVVRLEDFRWIEPRLPDGEGALALRMRGRPDHMEVRVRDLDLRVGESVVRGTFGADLADEVHLVQTRLELAPLDLRRLEPWLGEPLPVSGLARGWIAADGTRAALRTEGDLTLEDAPASLGASRAEFSGTLHLDEPFGATSFSLHADPFRYEWVARIVPDLPLDGTGSVRLDASGRIGRGVRFAADLRHTPDGGAGSRIRALGTVEGERDNLRLDVEGSLAPLSLATVARYRPDLPLSGEVSGTVRALGPLRDLQLRTELSTSAGPLRAQGRFDAYDLGRGYVAALETEGFELSRLWEAAPDPTVLSGRVEVEGRGLELDRLEGDAWGELRASQAGQLEVDRAEVRLRASRGTLELGHFALETSLLTAEGEGTLALRDDAPEGEVVVRWDAPSLGALRPWFLDRSPITRDTLTALEEEVLRLEGVDPDTLPLLAEVDVDGRGSGEIVLRGAVRAFSAEGRVDVVEGYWGGDRLERVHATFLAEGLPHAPWSVETDVRVDEASVAGRSLDSAEGWMLVHSDRSGQGRLTLRPASGEEHRLAGSFQLDTMGGTARLEELALRFQGAHWLLEEPAGLTWIDRSITFDDLRMTSAGEVPMRLRATGTLPLEEGEADFHLDLSSLNLSRVVELAQSDLPLEGLLDLGLDVGGTAESPILSGQLSVSDLRYDEVRVSEVDLGFGYRDLMLSGTGELLFEGQRLLTVTGTMPADLSFRSVKERFPDGSLDVRVRADRIPAASALGFLEVLEDVQGVLDADVHLRGSRRSLEPTGSVRLRDGAFSLPELGLRPAGIRADLDLGLDRTVRVDAEVYSRGPARVGGTIRLDALDDPTFDLHFQGQNFQAVERRDVTARVGGELTLEGRYSRPHISGGVRVEQGTLFLEEFARTAEVVDLTDPAFFDVVDTTLVADPRVFVPPENAFLRNLRVDVDLQVPRDLWLRGRDMNVEVGGDLIVTYDRPQREIILVGTLEPIRGSYMIVGRNFQVQEGTVEFVGTPGLNPSLSIQAVNRLRREGGEPLDIVAAVEGTLEAPRIQLSSNAQPPIAESDLISYLIFGRPSHALGAGESSILQGAAGAGVTLGLGTLATQLGSAVAQQVGFDYFAITQARVNPGMGSPLGLAGTFAETQIEVGQYVGQDLFLALVLRPLTGLGARTQTQVPGARIEWRFSDQWMLEGVIEDRFSREGTSGFGELGVRLSKVAGLSIFREWGW